MSWWNGGRTWLPNKPNGCRHDRKLKGQFESWMHGLVSDGITDSRGDGMRETPHWAKIP